MNIQEIQEEYSEQSRENIAKAYQRFQDALVEHSDSSEYFNAVKEWEYKGAYQVDILELDNLDHDVKCICGVKLSNVFEFSHIDNADRCINVGSHCLLSFEDDMDDDLRSRIRGVRTVFTGSRKHSIQYCKINRLINEKHIKFIEDQNEYKALRKRMGRLPRVSDKQKKYYEDIKKKANKLFSQRNPCLINKYLESL